MRVAVEKRRAYEERLLRRRVEAYERHKRKGEREAQGKG